MLNILLGIGLGGTYMTMQSAKDKHQAYPDKPLQYGSYHLELPGTLFISAITVLATLLLLLILVPSNNCAHVIVRKPPCMCDDVSQNKLRLTRLIRKYDN